MMASHLQIEVDLDRNRVPEVTSETAAVDSKKRRDFSPGQTDQESGELSMYSFFTPSQKKYIVTIAASVGWFSTVSSFIYFPAIPFIAKDLKVSVENINLTVTSYLIASGIFPSITGDVADLFGRRPVFIASLGVYFLANVALALQRSYGALFGLRMLQSAAISGEIYFFRSDWTDHFIFFC